MHQQAKAGAKQAIHTRVQQTHQQATMLQPVLAHHSNDAQCSITEKLQQKHQLRCNQLKHPASSAQQHMVPAPCWVQVAGCNNQHLPGSLRQGTLPVLSAITNIQTLQARRGGWWRQMRPPSPPKYSCTDSSQGMAAYRTRGTCNSHSLHAHDAITRNTQHTFTQNLQLVVWQGLAKPDCREHQWVQLPACCTTPEAAQPPDPDPGWPVKQLSGAHSNTRTHMNTTLMHTQGSCNTSDVLAGHLMLPQTPTRPTVCITATVGPQWVRSGVGCKGAC